MIFKKSEVRRNGFDWSIEYYAKQTWKMMIVKLYDSISPQFLLLE